MSPEARALIDPSAAFRQLMREQGGGWWVAARRPLRLLFVMGCVVSFQASGRLTARLIVDGAVSFAFIPVFELASLAIVYWRRPQPISFARASDLFFAANAPWLVWLLGFVTLRSVQTPRQATALPLPLLWTLEVSLLAIAAWTFSIDRRFFREVLPRPDGRSDRDLLLQRAIAWSCGLWYFFGLAVWPEIAGRIFR
jgi:hypothetical protein